MTVAKILEEVYFAGLGSRWTEEKPDGSLLFRRVDNSHKIAKAEKEIKELFNKVVPEKVKNYPIKIINRTTNTEIDTNETEGLNDYDRGFNQAITTIQNNLKGLS